MFWNNFIAQPYNLNTIIMPWYQDSDNLKYNEIFTSDKIFIGPEGGLKRMKHVALIILLLIKYIVLCDGTAAFNTFVNNHNRMQKMGNGYGGICSISSIAWRPATAVTRWYLEWIILQERGWRGSGKSRGHHSESPGQPPPEVGNLSTERVLEATAERFPVIPPRQWGKVIMGDSKYYEAISDSFNPLPLHVPGSLTLSNSEKAEALAHSFQAYFPPVNDPCESAVMKYLMRLCMDRSLLSQVNQN
jgi:hypothetical protein